MVRATSAFAFAFLALALGGGAVDATSRGLLQAAPEAAAAAAVPANAASGPQVQSQTSLNLPPGVTLTAPDGVSPPEAPKPDNTAAERVAKAAEEAQKEVVDAATMRQFQALEAQRDAARAADPSSDPLNAPRDDVLKTITLPTADEMKAFAESEQVKSFREALAEAPSLPAIAAPKLPFVGGAMPPAPPKPNGAAAARQPPHHGPSAVAPPHLSFASKHQQAPKAPQPPPQPEPEESEEEAADDVEVDDEGAEVETADDESADDESAPAAPHVIEAKVVDAKGKH